MREILRWGMGVGVALLLGVGVGALTGSDIFGIVAFGLVMSVFLMVAVLAYPPREIAARRIGSGRSGGAADVLPPAGCAGGAGPGVEDGCGGGFDGGGGFGGGFGGGGDAGGSC